MVLYVLLAAACLGLAVPVAVLDARWLILPAALLVLAAVLLAFHIRRLRRFVAVNLGGRSFAGSKMQVSLAALPVPLMLLSDGVVIWYNDQFRDQVLGGRQLPGRLRPRSLRAPPRPGPCRQRLPLHRLCQPGARRRRRGAGLPHQQHFL